MVVKFGEGSHFSAEAQRALRDRTNKAFRDYITRKIENSGLSKRELARRIGRPNASVYVWFKEEGCWYSGWTFETMVLLLAAIGEELVPCSAPIGSGGAQDLSRDWITLVSAIPEGYERARQQG